MEEVLVRLPGLLLGVVLVAAVATDAVSTLVTTQRRSGRWWPTYVFYRRTWRLWRGVARHIGSEQTRERLLAVYGPLSLLGLLVIWVLLLLIGWGLVWWVLQDRLSGVHSYLDAVYFAGVGFFTVGFGDVVPVGGVARLLARDDPTDERTSSTGLIEAWHDGGGLDGLAAAFADWERWCAEVFDSHTAYPMLALFRSRQPGQHWLTALGVVTDAASICLAAVRGARTGPALRLYRRATGLLRTVGMLPAVSKAAAPAADDDEQRVRGEAAFQAIYRHLEGHGVPLYPYDRAWEDLRRLRAEYLPYLRATIAVLLVPPEFRNHATPLPLDDPERAR
jgi:hypothetical protein